MRTLHRTATAVGLAVALLMAACGDDAEGPNLLAGQNDGQEPDADPDPVPGSNVAVVGTDTDLGRILVDANGMTLYGFTNDADGQSACTGTCADAWPPLAVGPDWEVGPELDSAIFNTYTREDGSEQLVVGPWPLYTFSEDTVPGDTKGQGSGGVWFVVSADDGTLIRDGADGGDGEPDDAAADDAAADDAADVQVGQTDLGEVLTDAGGRTLYAFTDDADGFPTCTGECAGTWPPLLVEGEPSLVEGLDPTVFTTVDGAEGGTQLVAGSWPLYTFTGDSEPGDVNGHGSSGVWFAVAPDGSLIGGG